MKEAYGRISFILSEREYYQRFSDEYYANVVEKYKRYFPGRTAEEERKKDEETYDNYWEVNIPVGCSRIGGPVVDLPDEIEYPDGYYFMAQLNCTQIKPFDTRGLLPEKGFLYFFSSNDLEEGRVFYTPKEKERLHRVTKEHEGCYYAGKTVERYAAERESISSRYVWENGTKEWDYFGGEDVSKIYGIYTNCQAREEEVLEFMEDENIIILLQIGSDYLGEGCHNVCIDRNDLIKKDFSNCAFTYHQS